MNFSIDRFHYTKAKLENCTTKVLPDWKHELTERKKQFSKHFFIVSSNEEVLFMDTFLLQFLKPSLHKHELNFHFENQHACKIYWMQLHTSGHQKTNITFFGEDFTLFHENVVCQTSFSEVCLSLHGSSHYYHVVNSKTEQLFHQEIQIHAHAQCELYYFQKSQQSKVKIDQQIHLYDNTKVNAVMLHNIIEKQVRDDALEFIHAAPNSQSNITYQALNKGKAVSQVNSIIGKEALYCETHQKLSHILQSDDAQSFSKPNLMISNNQVVASHGNSIGSVDEELLYYLQQRGLDTTTAEKIIFTSIMEGVCNQTEYAEQLKNYLLMNN